MANLERYLKPSFLCESDDPEIKKLARKICENEKDDLGKAKLIFKWVRDNVAWDLANVVGAKGILKRKPMRGICVDKASLFIALCRASGIPARYLLVWGDFDFKIPLLNGMSHAAAEVYVNNKWVIADPTFGKHTARIVPKSVFGKPTWKKATRIIPVAKLPLILPIAEWFMNTFSQKYMELREIIREELRRQGLKVD